MKQRTPESDWESWDDEGTLYRDGLPYWLRTPPIPWLLRRVGYRKRKDTETLDLFESPPKKKRDV